MPLVFQELDNHRSELDRHQQNSSRAAEAEGYFSSTGIGSIEFDTRLDFGVTFIRKPVVSYGSEIDVDELSRVMDGLDEDLRTILNPDPDNGTPAFPLVTGFVTDWDTDSKGFYTGAWCGVRVYYPVVSMTTGDTSAFAEVTTIPVEVLHHFRFSGIGMKDIPTELTDAKTDLAVARSHLS